MNRLHVLAAAGLVALAACTDQPTTPTARPAPVSPRALVTAVPIGVGNSANDVAQTLGGPGVTIQNVTYVGAFAATGTYTGGTNAIGFDGIVLSTGRASQVGPNLPFNTSTSFFTPGDAELTAIAGVPTRDAAILSFEIVPASGDSAYFEYVFASDEYPEFAGGSFADAFILKVNGVNCALIGSPPVPISINTVNSFTNSSYYRVNTFPADISADALTTVLTCRAAVNPGVPNTVKLAIADGGDSSVDSWVFIRAGSFSTTPPGGPVNTEPVLAPIANQAVNEGSTLSFTASATDADAGQTITYSLVGAPAGASIDPATGVFSWTPTDDNPTATPADAYTFTVRATDSADPAAFDEQQVTVTVSNVAPTITSITGPAGPIALSGGSAVAHITVSFTDPGSGDTHTTSIGCGPFNIASPSGDCTYTSAGVYTIIATVTDDDGGSDTETSSQYVVVYDPGAGFVTGGGWINSPAGAYAANPALTGKANFGFNAKYQHGATVPDGQTQFNFQAAGFNFHSTAYEWLVVAGARAQYKGTGTINGSGSYNFLLTVIDGQQPGGGGVDRFRLKVWGPGGVIYDNQMGGGDDATPTTALGGGSIVIHH
ncbi:MAG TPA: choice-of-anchor L domain-containing protein [Longimicrobium sp.]|nr:choice-of-anchor L domain-containing protein [Longimicrobium sp.]